MILFISTYEINKLTINNVIVGNISAIVVSDTATPITVSISDPKAIVPVFHMIPAERIPYTHKMTPNLVRHTEGVSDENHVMELIEYINDVTLGKNLDAYSVNYAAKINAPAHIFSENEFKSLQAEIEQQLTTEKQWK